MNELGNTPADKDYNPSGISKAAELWIAGVFLAYSVPDTSVKELREIAEKSFIAGYQQAEKDLALTWEDVKEIVRIADGMMYSADSLADIEKRLGIQPYYTEVLTRFKKFKEESHD